MGQLILVEGGGSDSIIEAVGAHGKLSDSSSRITYRLSLWELEGNRFLLELPTEVHAYDLCNLVNWLGDPAVVAGVRSSSGWFHNERESFYLEPDPSRGSGDTLRGATDSGNEIQLYLPELILAEHSGIGVAFKPAPSIPPDKPAARFSYETEELGEAMNPGLLTYSELADIPVWDRQQSTRSGCAVSLLIAILNAFR